MKFLLIDGKGAIHSTYYGPEKDLSLNTRGMRAIEWTGKQDVTCLTHYFDGAEIRKKGAFPEHSEEVIDLENIWEIRIAGVPEGTEVTWPDGDKTIETDGEVIAEIPYPGEYRFVLDHLHFEVLERRIYVAPRD